ncbi:MAG: D-tyrosyl-tRNA(Tyr) deacylase [Candidatus Cloacimonetes bacterium]|nr:D-tyrosyl-tRNA(Tyr) deacylase [Candidatus Cloacimonadota bacterium]MCF7813403.1 D-tyrosyl-tRNA(Tyr) deacylase [Candidatus Cloacimonadota bacterium]MCF7867472.1 D-tyrosyl-tRNA(Tyr) deacylase [Candidatus Cloacimonadota bacterium]MCF7883024.1 D-tyrosyl-tRNA(Tyr) deacylase [Candidatus Cloacimonadota bacterium]
MKLVVQRVSQASVSVDEKIISTIGTGFLIMIGVSIHDDGNQIDWLAKKVSELRVFPDEKGKMNLSIKDIGGEVLLVSQFTLYASCQKGRRPDFNNAAKPDLAEKLYLKFGESLKLKDVPVKFGEFGAMMQVKLCNEGPVTIILER